MFEEGAEEVLLLPMRNEKQSRGRKIWGRDL